MTHPAKLAGVAAIPREETRAKRVMEKAVKEKKKLEKAEKRASTIRKLAAVEQKGTELYANETTPRALPLRRGREVERRVISSPPSAKELEESDLTSEPFIPGTSESELTTADEDNNTDISETKTKPPRKRGKKTQVRQAVQRMKETAETLPADVGTEGEETPRPPRTKARNPRPEESVSL